MHTTTKPIISALLFLLFALVGLSGARGQFSNPQSYPSGITPPYMGSNFFAVGDINSDGRNDVVISTNIDGIVMGAYANYPILVSYLQDTSGQLVATDFYTHPLIYGTVSTTSPIIIKDMNGDGKNDVVIQFNDSIAILYQNHLHKLDSVKIYDLLVNRRIRGYQVDDFNGDGLTDICVAYSDDYNTAPTLVLEIVYQLPSGLFGNNSILTYPIPGWCNDYLYDFQMIDVSNDGIKDLVFLAPQFVIVIPRTTLGISSLPYTRSFPFFSSTPGMVFSDMNNDGKMDIVVGYGGNYPNSFLGVYYQGSSGVVDSNCSSLGNLPEISEVHNILIEDWNCNGKKDLLYGGLANLDFYQIDSSVNLTPISSYTFTGIHFPLEKNWFCSADVNGDNKKDIITAMDGTLYVLYNQTDCQITKIENGKIDTKSINLYPNPALTHFTVEFDGNTPLEIALTDNTGKTVLRKTVTSAERIDVSTLSSGVYTVRIVGTSTAWKLFKQ